MRSSIGDWSGVGSTVVRGEGSGSKKVGIWLF